MHVNLKKAHIVIWTSEIEGTCDTYYWQIVADEVVLAASDVYTNKAECRQEAKERFEQMKEERS